MNIIHHVPHDELIEVVSEKLADYIIRNREGRMSIKAGGGGIYGKIENVD